MPWRGWLEGEGDEGWRFATERRHARGPSGAIEFPAMLTSFIGVAQTTWSAWAPWANVAATLLVGGGALWLAWRQLGHLRQEAKDAQEASKLQLDAIERQIRAAADAANTQLSEMESARRASSRPVLKLAGVDSVDIQGQVGLVLLVDNIGMGSCIEVAGDVWCQAVTGPQDGESFDNSARGGPNWPANGNVNSAEPIPVGSRTRLFVVDGGRRPLLVRDSSQWAVFVRLRYSGVHGRGDEYVSPNPPACYFELADTFVSAR